MTDTIKPGEGLYRVLTSPKVTPAQYATAPTFASLADALEVMGEGVVMSRRGLIAFHHKWADFLAENPHLVATR